VAALFFEHAQEAVEQLRLRRFTLDAGISNATFGSYIRLMLDQVASSWKYVEGASRPARFILLP